MSQHESTRRILSATSILAGAGVVTLLLSLVRTKTFALLLGPSGIGLLGLINSLLASGTVLAGMGVGTSGVRLVSAAFSRGDQRAIGHSRTVLVTVQILLAILVIGFFWLLREPIGMYLLGHASRVPMVVWIGAGIGLSLLAGAQIAVLNGLRRVSEFARVQVLSAILATVFGVGSVWIWGAQAILIFVLGVPLSSLVVATCFVSRLDIPFVRVGAREIAFNGIHLARLGVPFMLAQLVITGGLLAVRARIEFLWDTDALGIFEAAWLISSVYLSAVLTAMTTDYYPRLSGMIDDDSATAALINDQTRVALWLCGPVCVALIGLAPVAISVLFSDKFSAAVEILRLQVIGDIMKVMAWPLGFVLLARNDGRRYLVLESSAIGALVVIAWFGLPRFGLRATGFGVLAMYCVYLPLGRFFVRRHLDFDWDRSVKADAAITLSAAICTALFAMFQPLIGGIVGILLGGSLAWRSWGQLRNLVGVDGWRRMLRASTPSGETRPE